MDLITTEIFSGDINNYADLKKRLAEVLVDAQQKLSTAIALNMEFSNLVKEVGEDKIEKDMDEFIKLMASFREDGYGLEALFRNIDKSPIPNPDKETVN